jgi:hypothetical protein
MPRPCTCDRQNQGLPYTLDQCRLCWLYHNDQRYKVLWDGADLPPITQQIGTLATSTARYMASGFLKVPLEVLQTRRQICQTCDRWDSDQNRCRACGCYLEAKFLNKLRMASESCPIGRWGTWEAPAT